MSFIDPLFSMPVRWLAVVLTLFMITFALAGQWAVRRWILPHLQLKYDDAYFAAALVQSAMLLYGLIAALTAVGVWQRYSSVAEIVSSEATAITSLWRDLGGYPQPLRDESRATLKGYTSQIINEAWPLQRQGKIPQRGVEWMDRLQNQIFVFEPTTDSQRILHAEAVRSFNVLVQQRRQRLDSIRGGLPGVLWIVLLPGALGCIAMAWFFHVPNPRFQAIMLTGLSCFIAMLLFVIIALDRPFAGDTGISADSYQLIYDHHMRQ